MKSSYPKFDKKESLALDRALHEYENARGWLARWLARRKLRKLERRVFDAR